LFVSELLALNQLESSQNSTYTGALSANVSSQSDVDQPLRCLPVVLLQFFVSLQLLPGICSVLGDCLQLELVCCPAAPSTSWCEEAYLITATDKQAAQRGSSSSSSSGNSGSSQQAVRGHIWLLFDQSYQGMPATHMVSPGLATEQGQASPAGTAGTPLSQQQQQQQSTVAGLLGTLQATTVAVVFPSTFCSANRGPHGSSEDSPDSSSGSSAFGLLQSLLHELGHALHFLLSVSGSQDPAAAGGHRASLEVMEAASHLIERMARNATCLQVRWSALIARGWEMECVAQCMPEVHAGGLTAPWLCGAGTLLRSRKVRDPYDADINECAG
jgi:hypothetical protein